MSLLSEKNRVGHLGGSSPESSSDSQANEQVGAQRYERSEDRIAYRNRYRPRQLYTRTGLLTLRVPQMRCDQFSTEIFATSALNRHWMDEL